MTKLDGLVLAVFQRLFFVPDLGKDQLEDLIKLILAAVGQYQLFQILNDLFEIKIPFEL